MNNKPQVFMALVILSLSSQVLPSTFSKFELRNAKLIEDYYFQYKSNRLRKALNTQKMISGKALVYKKMRTTFREGKRIAKNILNNNACSVKKIGDLNHIEKKFQSTFKRACFKHMSKVIQENKSQRLSIYEKKFLKENKRFFTSRKNSTNFKKRYNKLRTNDQKVVSDSIRKYILESYELPHQSAMNYLKIDEELTSFIQKNKLFDLNDSSYYQKTFNRLMTNMKNEFTSGDDEGLQESFNSLKDFYLSNKSRINDEKIWKNVLKNGKKLINNENYSDAIEFMKTASFYIAKDDVNESIFQVLFTKYLKNDIYQARKYIDEKKLIDNFDKLDSRLMYWTAFILDLSKDLILAKSLYKKTVESHPLSFYSILSLKRLQFFSPVNFKETLIAQDQIIVSDKQVSNRIKDNQKILSIYTMAGSQTIASFYATELRNTPVDLFFKKTTHLEKREQAKANYLISFFSKKFLYLDSFKTAYRGVDSKTLKLSQNIIQSLFPRNFSKFVKSSNKNLDYRIVLSLIRQESGFNKNARSPAGARGLMQIMPKTGRYLRRGLVTSELYNPKTNIKLGSKYLKYLLKKYDGNLMFTLAAYNAGEGNVRKWKKRIPFSGDVISDIELIPFKETKKYVKLIYRNLFFYRLGDRDYNILKETPEQTFKVANFSK